MLPLGDGDTTLVSDVDMRRTLDGGLTWTEVGEPSVVFGALREVPPASDLQGDLRPGHLLAGDRFELYRSDDRGASWHPVPGTPLTSSIEDVLVLPPGHPDEGRLLVAATDYRQFVGTTGRDGGLVLVETADSQADPDRTIERMRAMPSGRLIATGYYRGGGVNVAFVSDDGGMTWRVVAPLPEPQKGIPGTAELAVIGPWTALAVGGRGVVYRTDDDGETWAVVGRAPVEALNAVTTSVAVGPGGEVYVGIARSGTDRDWVVRTAEPVTVAAESPPGASGAALRVSPNPASGSVRIEVAGARSPEAVEVVIVDARGRDVARASGVVEVSTAGWAPGTYVARAVVGGETVSARFTVVR